MIIVTVINYKMKQIMIQNFAVPREKISNYGILMLMKTYRILQF